MAVKKTKMMKICKNGVKENEDEEKVRNEIELSIRLLTFKGTIYVTLWLKVTR